MVTTEVFIARFEYFWSLLLPPCLNFEKEVLIFFLIFEFIIDFLPKNKALCENFEIRFWKTSLIFKESSNPQKNVVLSKQFNPKTPCIFPAEVEICFQAFLNYFI